ncbi:serine/threonine-protein kinase pim-3-like [Anneissia japonica]|uniref:serine/threonine-protein kinase pim-3-like n=1 Tax=Anneissia japonica TaxID=1529436 RepID=UPI00142582C8|nr:serine/threonine-protein kinase pim-3-like [Anneissia japonica]
MLPDTVRLCKQYKSLSDMNSLLKAQCESYKEDFMHERRDRELMASRSKASNEPKIRSIIRQLQQLLRRGHDDVEMDGAGGGNDEESCSDEEDRENNYGPVRLLGPLNGRCFRKRLLGDQKSRRTVVRNSSASYLTNESGETILAEAHILRVVSGIEGCIGFVDVHQVKDCHLLVMERPLRSSDLFQVLEKVGSIPKERCRCFFRQIVDACVGCFKRNVVHGDLKMENVIVDLDTDRIKLVDFGFAKFVDDQPIASAFGTTYHYLPPEMLKHRFMYAVPALIWSLGIMLFEMITGEEVERGRRPYLQLIDDEELLSLLDRMLAVDWRKRPSLKQVSDHPWTNKLTANGEYVQ